MLVKTNVDISIKMNHGIRHFVQMLRRGKPGTSAKQISLIVLMLRFVFTRRKQKHKNKEKENF